MLALLAASRTDHFRSSFSTVNGSLLITSNEFRWNAASRKSRCKSLADNGFGNSSLVGSTFSTNDRILSSSAEPLCSRMCATSFLSFPSRVKAGHRISAWIGVISSRSASALAKRTRVRKSVSGCAIDLNTSGEVRVLINRASGKSCGFRALT